jgi:hypothetical protein
MLSIKDGESMTIYKNQVINPEKPWSFMDDTKENILKDLAEYILDPVFEEYGNFVYMPTWCDEEAAEKYKGLTAISGNFLNLSHAFSLLTDDEELIKELTEAIRENQETEKYKQAKIRLMERRLEEKRQYEEKIQK